MGGFFSKNDEQETQRPQYEAATIWNQMRIASEEQRRRQEQQRQELEFARLIRLRQQEEQYRQQLEEQRRQQTREQLHLNRLKIHQVRPNLDLLNSMRNAFNLPALYEFPYSTYTEEIIPPNSPEFHNAHSTFRRSNKNVFFKVTQIVKVHNTFLLLHYRLTHEMYKEREGEYQVEKTTMFHGTKKEFLPSICSMNFDRSKVITHKFGRGISFARDAYYATHYHHDNMRKLQKVMILVEVVNGEIQDGDRFTVVPEEPCYTSKNFNGSVLVKYDDASYYPKYIVHYEGFHPKKIDNDEWAR